MQYNYHTSQVCSRTTTPSRYAVEIERLEGLHIAQQSNTTETGTTDQPENICKIVFYKSGFTT